MADKRKILLESYDIRVKRIQYLKQLQRYVHEERPIVYTDESYIHSSHSQSKRWTDDSVLGLKKPLSKGKRLIMVHASSKAEVVPNALQPYYIAMLINFKTESHQLLPTTT
jgi:hypothetical protein